MQASSSSNDGARRLTKIIGTDSQVRRDIAHECRCSEQAVRGWEAGSYKPNYASRVLMEQKRGIPGGSWDVVVPVKAGKAA